MGPCSVSSSDSSHESACFMVYKESSPESSSEFTLVSMSIEFSPRSE